MKIELKISEEKINNIAKDLQTIIINNNNSYNNDTIELMESILDDIDTVKFRKAVRKRILEGILEY